MNNEQQTSVGRNRFHRSADDSFYHPEAVRRYHMVMVVGVVSAVDIGDIMGDFCSYCITCGRTKIKMNNADFTERWDKMCKALQDKCNNCKLSFMNNRFSEPCDMFVKEHLEEASEIINEWIKENENGCS